MNMPDTIRDLSTRLDSLDRHIGRVETMAMGKADGVQMVRELDLLRAELRELQTDTMAALREMRSETAAAVVRADSTANDVIRSGRSETMRLMLAAMTAFATLLGGVVIAYATGKLG